MKKTVLLLSALIASFLAFAVVYEGVNIPQLPARYLDKPINPKSPMAKIIAKAKAEGGYLRGRAVNGKSIRVINKQKLVSAAPLNAMAEDVFNLLHVSVEIVSALPNDQKTAVSIFVEDGGSDTALLIAPEKQTAVVNVRSLYADRPSSDVLESRVRKELWRALVYVLGGGNSQDKSDVMRLIRSPSDLDASINYLPSPEPFHVMMASMEKLGICKAGYVTYKQACVEGWAPPPTTELEKKIWNQVHELPTNPITIKYNAQKGE